MWSDFTLSTPEHLRKTRLESELDDELRFHLERQVEKYVTAGIWRTGSGERTVSGFRWRLAMPSGHYNHSYRDVV
jgi:hypothetical protein